jgi:putative FmdB family regulatory protein
MPIYEYRCDACGRSFDEVRRIEDRDRPFAHLCPKAVTTRDHAVKVVECRRKMALIARTPNRWGDTNGGYSRALGVHYNTSQDLDRAAEAKGAVRFEDLGQHGILDALEAQDNYDPMDVGDVRADMIAAADAIHASGQQPTLDGVPISSVSDIV